jgi:hypothetical protein
MIKRLITYVLLSLFLLAGCATKSYVRLEDERFHRDLSSADSSIVAKMSEKDNKLDAKQDSMYREVMLDTDSLFLDLMGEIYSKNHELDSLQHVMTIQRNYIDSLMIDVDSLQVLETRFKDADYTMFDLSRIRTNLDSLMINQKHLSRELQYMIRDLNLIERNLMDIMNYSMNSIKTELQRSNALMMKSLYKNNSTAQKMIMVYLMTNTSNDPNELLSYIDSIYAMGPALDTVNVQFGAPEPDSTSQR